MRRFFPFFLIALFAPALLPATEFAVHPGETVVFLGDSITEQQLYTRYVEEYTLSRFPGWHTRFINAGWGGDRTAKAKSRIARDVLSQKPDLVTICFGMNDGFYHAFKQEDLDLFLDGYRSILDQLGEAKARAVLLSNGVVCPYVGAKGLEPYNDTLERFAAGTQDLARTRGLPCGDLFHPFLQVMDKMHEQKAEPFLFNAKSGDRIHPDAPGHLVMACVLLQAMGAPAEVSTVELDCSSPRPQANTAHCRLRNLEMGAEGRLSFERLDEAWPWYIHPECRSVLDYLPVLEELNRYSLKVSGLSRENYRLVVDGTAVGNYSREELAKGINLALAEGPWQEAGKQLAELSKEKSSLYFSRWRHVQLGLPEHRDKTRVLRAMDQWMGDLQRQMESVAEPHPTRWVLEPRPD